MPYVSVNTDVEVELDMFDDGELIEELEDRGFKVIHKDDVNALDDEMEEVVWRFKNGYILDAMLLLERKYPDLYGITKLARS